MECMVGMEYLSSTTAKDNYEVKKIVNYWVINGFYSNRYLPNWKTFFCVNNQKATKRLKVERTRVYMMFSKKGYDIKEWEV
jgi:hypothetical protein